ncbi:MAG TPA: LemA family protein, partial [Actinomycetota bacterium]|nr:LemA family protein [Actinomycetota bacterium]
GIVAYNRFVSQRQLVRNAYANIDTELRRRYDLIPNLVETVRGYAEHERQALEAVIRARQQAIQVQGSPAAQAQAENILTQALRQLFAVAEAYPNLKANENFLALQAELSNTEDRIQTSRRFYNGNVQDYNRRVQSFPSTIIARMFGFKEEEFFEIEEQLREAGAPRVDFTGVGQPGGPPTPGVTPPAGGPPPAAGPPPAMPPAAPAPQAGGSPPAPPNAPS